MEIPEVKTVKKKRATTKKAKSADIIKENVELPLVEAESVVD